MSTTITLNTANFMDLLEGVSVVTAKGKMAPEGLTCVYLSASDGLLTARASDRYRAISGTLVLDSNKPVSLPEIPITADGFKRIKGQVSLTKSRNRYFGDVTLTWQDDTRYLTITTNGGSVSLSTPSHALPSFDHLIPTTYEPMDRIGVDLELIGSFSKVPRSAHTKGVAINFTGERKPISLEIPHALIKWTAMLMPCKVEDRAATLEKMGA